MARLNMFFVRRVEIIFAIPSKSLFTFHLPSIS